jgi:hypothetical protein
MLWAVWDHHEALPNGSSLGISMRSYRPQLDHRMALSSQVVCSRTLIARQRTMVTFLMLTFVRLHNWIALDWPMGLRALLIVSFGWQVVDFDVEHGSSSASVPLIVNPCKRSLFCLCYHANTLFNVEQVVDVPTVQI